MLQDRTVDIHFLVLMTQIYLLGSAGLFSDLDLDSLIISPGINWIKDFNHLTAVNQTLSKHYNNHN